MALARARQALRDFVVLGLHTNATYLLRVLSHPDVEAGDLHTNWLAAHHDALTSDPSEHASRAPPPRVAARHRQLPRDQQRSGAVNGPDQPATRRGARSEAGVAEWSVDRQADGTWRVAWPDGAPRRARRGHRRGGRGVGAPRRRGGRGRRPRGAGAGAQRRQGRATLEAPMPAAGDGRARWPSATWWRPAPPCCCSRR